MQRRKYGGDEENLHLLKVKRVNGGLYIVETVKTR